MGVDQRVGYGSEIEMEMWREGRGGKREGVYVTHERPPAIRTDAPAPGRPARLRWTVPARKT